MDKPKRKSPFTFEKITAWFLVTIWIGILSLFVSFDKDKPQPCPIPSNFPKGILLTSEPFQFHNIQWDEEIPTISQILVATPTEPSDIIKISNWAYQNDYRVRASGGKLNFSPLIISPSEAQVSCPKVILVDTTVHLITMKINPPDESGLANVTCGTGVILLNLLEFLEKNGYGFAATPSIGSISVGGMLATGTHGSGIPGSSLDSKSPGHTFGTLSNLVVEMTIIAWDEKSNSYRLKTIHRSENTTKAFLVHLGRTFVTSVTLRIGENQMLRTQTHFYIPKSELYANPKLINETTRSISKYSSTYGRIEILYSSERDYAWVTTWHEKSLKPRTATLVTGPLDYIFTTKIPRVFGHLLQYFMKISPSYPLILESISDIITWLGVTFTRKEDSWGPSKNHFLHSPLHPPRVAAGGYGFLTSRSNLQQVVWKIKSVIDTLDEAYRVEGGEGNPGAGVHTIRVGGIDNPLDVGIPGAEVGALSGAKPLKEYPDYDIVIWMDLISFVNHPNRSEYMWKLQTLLYQEIHEKYAVVRPEWSKEWGYKENEGPFNNFEFFKKCIKSLFSNKSEEWNWVVTTFDQYDPYKIFSNGFLDKVFAKV